MVEIILSSGLIVGFICSVCLAVKSIIDFTHTGPKIRDEVLEKYRVYSILMFIRLVFFSFIVFVWMCWVGGYFYLLGALLLSESVSWVGGLVFSLLGVFVITVRQFCNHLLLIPSSIMMSSNYKMTRFNKLHSHLSVSRLRFFDLFCLCLWFVLLSSVSVFLSEHIVDITFFQLFVISTFLFIPVAFSMISLPPRSRKNDCRKDERPNILMIGSDTFRVDRLGMNGHEGNLTPFLDALTKRGKLFTNCYTPIARTAPSLVSIMTGMWPHTHGIRTNFTSTKEAELAVECLPKILASNGYSTSAISDWSGSDLTKFNFGYEEVDAPDDQWNLKYLIRQGPKDIRLFLSLFTHNQLGKKFLPEIYYLAGVPLTKHLCRDARKKISQLAAQEKPFFLNLFMATTHPPFGSEYPYYEKYSREGYDGESKYAMSRLVDPFDIIRSQKEPKEAFDLDQINDLYDGCVRCFDDEARKVVHHLKACGLEQNTMIVIYSDHGMELFEHDTWGQGNSAQGEASPKVPLIIVTPDGVDFGKDERVVRTVDITPTLLDFCGIKSFEDMNGVSLRKYLENKTVDDKLIAYFETGVWMATPPGQHKDHLSYPEILDLLEVSDIETGTLSIKSEYRDITVRARDRMIREGDWKLVSFSFISGSSYKLFNLVEDPECKNDVFHKHTEIANSLIVKLKELLLTKDS